MHRLFVFCMVVGGFISCSKNQGGSAPPDKIPDIIEGVITEFIVTPTDINTPDRGTFFINANNRRYQVDFTAAAQSASDAILRFASDTILNDQSREFTNLGRDAIAYNPLAPNEISILFNDGRRVTGTFDINSS